MCQSESHRLLQCHTMLLSVSPVIVCIGDLNIVCASQAAVFRIIKITSKVVLVELCHVLSVRPQSEAVLSSSLSAALADL